VRVIEINEILHNSAPTESGESQLPYEYIFGGVFRSFSNPTGGFTFYSKARKIVKL